MTLLLPEYDLATEQCWRDSMNTTMRARDPLLAKIAFSQMPHLAVGPSSQATSIGYQAELQLIEETISFKLPELLSTNIKAWDATISECADSTLPQVMRVIFCGMDDAIRQGGNVTDAGGRPLSWDVILDGLEKIELDFDENGRHRELTIVAPPEAVAQMNPTMSAEQEKRYAEITKRKWGEHLARRRIRKLDK